MFKAHQYNDIIMSDFGIALWLSGVVYSIYTFGFAAVLRTYLIPYLWVNHWLVLITFLQHTDPLLPHYRASAHTFPRGALATLDRNLLGDLGSVMGAIGAFATHGISETHILHHVASKIPHYHAWEASAILKAKLQGAGMQVEGNAGGWAECYRVYKECKVSSHLCYLGILADISSFSSSRMKVMLCSSRTHTVLLRCAPCSMITLPVTLVSTCLWTASSRLFRSIYS